MSCCEPDPGLLSKKLESHTGVTPHGLNRDCRRFGAVTGNQCNGRAPVPVFLKFLTAFPVRQLTEPGRVGDKRLLITIGARPLDGGVSVKRKRCDMRCSKQPPVRNKIDLSDPSQVRVMKRRLGLSTGDLQRVVEKVGNSISAV